MEWAGLLAVAERLGLPLAMALAILFALAKDMLVTRGQVERLLAVKDQMITMEQRRGDEWKATSEAERAARLSSDEQVGDLLEVVEVHTVLLRAIQDSVAGKKAS